MTTRMTIAHWTMVSTKAAGALSPNHFTISGQATIAASDPIRMIACTTAMAIAVRRSFQNGRVSLTP